jgi:hypothetical protein
MDKCIQAKNFVGLTEIKNVFMAIPFHEIPTNSGYLEINDQIVYNYERTLDQITLLKRSKYDKIKQEKKLELEKKLAEMTTNSDYYIGIENDINENNAHAQLDVANVVYDKTHTLKLEEEIKTNVKAYSDYIDMIHVFLKKMDYLYVDNKHVLTREIIMTSRNYQNYLTKLFREIIKLSIDVSQHRMKNANCGGMVNIKNTVNLSKVYQSDNFFKQFYEFTDNNIIRDKQLLLEKLIAILLVLVKNIKNTYKFLNSIINTYCVDAKINEKNNEFFEKILIKRSEYVRQLKQNQPLLPTSWGQLIKNMFISPKKINGKKSYPLEAYFRYMSYWFEENNIVNDIRIFNLKVDEFENNTPIDYVNFLFGKSVTHICQFTDDEDFYTSLYNNPYETKKKL